MNKGAASVPPGKDEGKDGDGDGGVEIRLEDTEGHLDNANVRPRIDMDADEAVLLMKLRRMLHEDDFKRIFDAKNRRIGEL